MVCPNPVAFTIFGHDIYWYGILISLSVILAVIMVYREAKRKGLDADCMLDYALLTVPMAIVFARIYYVIFEWDQYASDPIRVFFIWEGGIAIYGSIIGGALATLIFSKWKKIPFSTLADLVAPGLVLGQAIGRWGNFFNQEAFGKIVTDSSLQFFPYAVYIERLDEWHMATFFYESMACLLIFIFLLIYRRKAKNAPSGNLFLWYGLLYGIERAYVEGLRTDSLWIFKGGIPIGQLIFFPNGLRVSQVLSLFIVLIFGILLLVRAVRRHKKKVRAEENAALDPDLMLVNEDALKEDAESSENAEDSAEEAQEPAEDSETPAEEAQESSEEAEAPAEEAQEPAEETQEPAEEAKETDPESGRE